MINGKHTYKTVKVNGVTKKVHIRSEMPNKAEGLRFGWLLFIDGGKGKIVTTVYACGDIGGWFEYEGLKFPNLKKMIEGILTIESENKVLA